MGPPGLPAVNPTLFDQEPTGRARQADPTTSRDAARRVRAGSVRALVIDGLRAGPATDDELCVRLGLPARRWPTVKTARSALTHQTPATVRWAGMVRDRQQVWELVP